MWAISLLVKLSSVKGNSYIGHMRPGPGAGCFLRLPSEHLLLPLRLNFSITSPKKTSQTACPRSPSSPCSRVSWPWVKCPSWSEMRPGPIIAQITLNLSLSLHWKYLVCVWISTGIGAHRPSAVHQCSDWGAVKCPGIRIQTELHPHRVSQSQLTMPMMVGITCLKRQSPFTVFYFLFFPWVCSLIAKSCCEK